MTASDEELARQIAIGDLDAFAQIYDRYSRRVHSWATQVLGSDRAEDAIQEVFLRLWVNARQFDPSRGTFAVWFMSIARHHLIAELRRRGRSETLRMASEIDAILERSSTDDPDPAEQAAGREFRQDVAAAVRALPKEQRQALVLAYFGGLTQSAIAHQLGLPLGTVKKRMRLGMQKLRSRLAAQRDPKNREHAKS